MLCSPLQVHRAILKGRLPVAVKMVPCPANAPPRMADSLLEEIKIMSRISHPNCVKCYGGCQKPPNIFIVEVKAWLCALQYKQECAMHSTTRCPLANVSYLLGCNSVAGNGKWYGVLVLDSPQP